MAYKYTLTIMNKLQKINVTLLFTILALIFVTTDCSAFTITDAEGNILEVREPFKRIISLYPAHTENLAALGLREELIGVTAADRKHPELSHKQVFSYHDDPELFIAAKPDLVLIRPMINRAYPQLISHLERMGITVISLQPRTVDELFQYWQSLASLSGRQKEGEQMTSQFTQKLERIAQTVAAIPADKRPRVYFEAIHDKMKTFSPDSIAVYCLEQAGGINIASDAVPRHGSNIAQYGKERILQKAGQIDVFLAQAGKMNPISMKILEEEPGFNAIKAFKNKRYALIDEEIVSRPTMNLIRGIEQIHHILYDSDNKSN